MYKSHRAALLTHDKSGFALNSANANVSAVDSTVVHAYPTLDIIACVILKLWTRPRSKQTW